MRRTQRSEALYAVYDSRIQVSEVLGAIVQRKDASESLAEAARSLHEVAARLGESQVGHRYRQFARLLESMVHLLHWTQAVRSAEMEADRHLRAAKQGARDLTRELGTDPEDRRLANVTSRITAIADVDEIEQVAELLLHTPLPLPLFAVVSRRPQWAPSERIEKATPDVSVAFVSFTLNDVAFGDPQTVEPNVLHDVTVEARVSRWPEATEELVLDVVSVEPADVYQLPRFSFRRPDGAAPYLLRQTGRMLLRVPQVLLARPLEFTYRAWFVPESCGVNVTVEGHRHLRVQSYDSQCNPQTGYQQVDQRLFEIRTRARSTPGVRDGELGDFLQIMATLGRVAGEALQDDIFEGTWSEAQFHQEIRKRLRDNPQIGSELEEHPCAAGGITDLSFHGIRIELKVVADRYATVEGAHRFLGQTTQYVAGSDRRLGVLCLLDCSPKASPPGSVVNDIDLQTVSPPGNRGGMPIFVGIVIIRGNLPTPSSLSRNG